MPFTDFATSVTGGTTLVVPQRARRRIIVEAGMISSAALNQANFQSTSVTLAWWELIAGSCSEFDFGTDGAFWTGLTEDLFIFSTPARVRGWIRWRYDT